MFHPDTDITLEIPGSIADGKLQYTRIPARGRLIDFSQRDIDYFGTIQEGKIVLVAPPEIPRLPGRIVIDGVTYELKSVKICRDLSGRVRGCRCAVV